MSEDHAGGCACGAVRFNVKGALPEAGACHCSQCRKQTGLYYATVTLDDAQVSWNGLDHATRYRSSPDAERAFCATCGSALYWKDVGTSSISLMAGAFDMPSGLKIGYHIFCADKADFYDITDDLPKFAQSNS